MRQTTDFAVIIPCYNLERAFPYNQFLIFGRRHPEMLLCFVDNGSDDGTKKLITQLIEELRGNACLFALNKNVPYAEACRLGILDVCSRFEFLYAGFLDPVHSDKLESWFRRRNELCVSYDGHENSGKNTEGNSLETPLDNQETGILFPNFIKRFGNSRFLSAAAFERNSIPFVFSSRFLTNRFAEFEIQLRGQAGKLAPFSKQKKLTRTVFGSPALINYQLEGGLTLRWTLLRLYLHYTFFSQYSAQPSLLKSIIRNKKHITFRTTVKSVTTD